MGVVRREPFVVRCVMNGPDLVRVESAVSATACGDLTWCGWPHDYVMAIGLSGQRNPVGFAVVRYLSDESAVTAWALVLILSTEMVRRGYCLSADANDFAWKAFEFWKDMRCQKCSGRGVVSHSVCPSCSGSGRKSVGDGLSAIRDGVNSLIEAENWMESQLRSRLKG